jgi:hypothetical protein
VRQFSGLFWGRISRNSLPSLSSPSPRAVLLMRLPSLSSPSPRSVLMLNEAIFFGNP